MEGKKVFKGLSEARKLISSSKVKKEGMNKFSGYSYYTPSQITSLVTDACYKSNIITQFGIEEKDGAYIGSLTIISLEDGSETVFSIPTAMPDIKATNTTQKLGGMVTYTERYLNMIAFAISDNNLDLDSQDNTGAKEPTKPKLTDERFNKALQRIEEGTYKKDELLKSFTLTESQKAKL